MPKARGGGSTRGGLFPLSPPLSLGGFGGPPPEKIFERFYVRFNGVFMRLGPDLIVLVPKIFLVA